MNFPLGHAKSIGVSNYLIRHLEEMKAYSSVVPALNQVLYSVKNIIAQTAILKDRGLQNKYTYLQNTYRFFNRPE